MSWSHRLVVFSIGVTLSVALTLLFSFAGPATPHRCDVHDLGPAALHSSAASPYSC